MKIEHIGKYAVRSKIHLCSDFSNCSLINILLNHTKYKKCPNHTALYYIVAKYVGISLHASSDSLLVPFCVRGQMSLETWDVVQQQPDGQKVCKDRGQHSRRMCTAAVSRAKAVQRVALPRDGQENRRNEKCMYLGRSQKITLPSTGQRSQRECNDVLAIMPFSYSSYTVLYVAVAAFVAGRQSRHTDTPVVEQCIASRIVLNGYILFVSSPVKKNKNRTWEIHQDS